MTKVELTPQQRAFRAACVAEAAKRHPGDYLAAIREGAAAYRASGRRGGGAKEAKRLVERQRIARVVTEALTAAQAPKPAPAAAPAAAREAPPAASPHEMTADQLAGAAASLFAASLQSPFWRESAPASAAPVAESAAPAGPPLHKLSGDEFRAASRDALTAYGRASWFGSPSWR